MVTLKNMLMEMQTWSSDITESDLTRAEKSGITTDNNEDLEYYVNGWKDGMYDDDPHTLVFDLLNLLDA